MMYAAAPTMTLGHLLFAAVTSAYILVGIWLEERDMVALFGGNDIRCSDYSTYGSQQLSYFVIKALAGRNTSKLPDELRDAVVGAVRGS